MAEKITIKPPYAPAINVALECGMTFEMIDAAIGCQNGWSKNFYEGYLGICKQIQNEVSDG
jgi:hypothetical protein